MMQSSSSSSEEDYEPLDERKLSKRDRYYDEIRGHEGQKPDLASRILQLHDETDSTTSNCLRSRPHGALSSTASNTTIPQRVLGTQPIFESNVQRTSAAATTSRTSSLKINRGGAVNQASSSPAYSFADEIKSHHAVTLQTPVLSAEDRSSSDRINHWSSSDLSSLQSCSVISVPVSCYASNTRPHQSSANRGTSFSSAGFGGSGTRTVGTAASTVEGFNSRYSSPAGRRPDGSSRGGSEASGGIVNPPMSVGRPSSLEVVEELHKLRLQLYVFILRCIAYPFTVALPQDPVRRYLKVTREYLNVLRERFTAFLNKELQVACDEALYNAVQHFVEMFLRNDYVEHAINVGGFSMNDIREVFITSIEKRLQRFDEINGLPKQTVVAAWKVKFDQICRGGEGPCPVANRLGTPQLELTNPTKEQLYDLFMRILSIKKYEHQILFNACQLDNIDEQAAQVRRELASLKNHLEEMALKHQCPKMVHKKMEDQYLEEQINNVNQLMLQLDTVPVGKSHGYTSGASSSAVGVVVQLQRRLKRYSDRLSPPAPPSPIAPGMTSPHFQIGGFNTSMQLSNGRSQQSSLGNWVTTEDSGGGGGSGVGGAVSTTLGDVPNVQLLSFINHVSGNISKMSIQLSFHLEVSICQLRPLRHLSGNKQIFCAIELEGCAERQRTASVKAAKPIWDTLAEFETSHPLPCLKIKLLKESTEPFALDNKELGRVILLPNPCTSRLPTWYKLHPTKNCNDILELQVAVRQERPSNLKYCGYSWVQGRTTFKKWKVRYVCLIQVSQYTFIMAAFKEARNVAHESMVLDGYTVDYCETNQELVAVAKAELATETGGLLSSSMPTLNKLKISVTSRGSSSSSSSTLLKNPAVVVVPSTREAALSGGGGGGGGGGTGTSGGGSLPPVLRLPRFFFNLVKEGDELTFAVSEEVEYHGWVQAIHRATGQSHKPVAPTRTMSKVPFRKGDRERAHHLGIGDLASVKPHKVDHLPLLKELIIRMLEYRFKDPFVSLGWLSPAESLVLDEYCNRFGLRECQRHLLFLSELLSFGEKDFMIDIDRIYYSYSLCADHVQGKTQEKGINTVLNTEMEEFQVVRTRLTAFLEKRLTEYRYYFPFNRPSGGLEKLLSLFERVINQSSEGNGTTEAVRSMIRVCLRNAAVISYERISDFTHREADLQTPTKQLQDLLSLAETCIDTLQQNEEFYAKSFIWFGDLYVEHSENFLSLLQMDLVDVLENMPADNWGVFQIFQLLNSCLLNSESHENGPFHTALLERFAPIVENYLNVMETSITTSLVAGIEREKWIPMSENSHHYTASADPNDLAIGSSSSSHHTHPDTDTESSRSVNAPPHRSLQTASTTAATGAGAPFTHSLSSPPLVPPQHEAAAAASAGHVSRRSAAKQSTVGPTSAFLDVLSRSRPLAFVSRVMSHNGATGMHSSRVGGAGGQSSSVAVITIPPPTSSNPDAEVVEGVVEGADGTELALSLNCARCCRTVGRLIFRLHALKEFIAELGWSERSKAASWAEKTRTMCSNLLREAARRTLIELDSTLRRASTSMDFVVPLECFTMLNTITAIRMQLFPLCNRHESEVSAEAHQGDKTESPGELSMSQPTSVRMYTETEAFLEGVHRQMSVILTDHLTSVLSTVLNKFARYDEGNIISSILTLAKPVDEDGRAYSYFINANLQILCQNLVDDVYLLSIFENWYTGQLRLIHDWLTQRRNNVLHPYQVKCLSTIVRKVFADFELQGVATHVLENMTYTSVCHRLQVEEATLSVSGSARDSSPASSVQSSSTPDARRKIITALGGGLSNLAQGVGLRPRQI